MLTILSVANWPARLGPRVAVERNAFVLATGLVKPRQADPGPSDAFLRAVARIRRARVSRGAAAELHLVRGQFGALGQAAGSEREAQSSADRHVVGWTVAGQRGSPRLSAASLGTRELSFETVTGIALQVEASFMSDEAVVHPAGVELETVEGPALLQTVQRALADLEAALLIEPGDLDPGSRRYHLPRHFSQKTTRYATVQLTSMMENLAHLALSARIALTGCHYVFLQSHDHFIFPRILEEWSQGHARDVRFRGRELRA